MLKISNWSLVGYIGSMFWIFSSAARYYYLYPDIDKFLAYVFLGLLGCAVSWLFNKQQEHSNTLLAMEDYLADKNHAKLNGKTGGNKQ